MFYTTQKHYLTIQIVSKLIFLQPIVEFEKFPFKMFKYYIFLNT